MLHATRTASGRRSRERSYHTAQVDRPTECGGAVPQGACVCDRHVYLGKMLLRSGLLKLEAISGHFSIAKSMREVHARTHPVSHSLSLSLSLSLGL